MKSLILVYIAINWVLWGCGGESSLNKGQIASQTGGDQKVGSMPSLCKMSEDKTVEMSEVVGVGAIRPNIRYYFRMTKDVDRPARTLVCREVDSNLDGAVDVVRFYDLGGEPSKEWRDLDYDGKIDSWIVFSGGLPIEEDVDINHDGQADEFKLYSDNKLARVRRDRNFDRKMDTWEMYSNGRLERVGIDENGDGRVDRWDRDMSIGHSISDTGDAGTSQASGLKGEDDSKKNEEKKAGEAIRAGAEEKAMPLSEPIKNKNKKLHSITKTKKK